MKWNTKIYLFGTNKTLRENKEKTTQGTWKTNKIVCVCVCVSNHSKNYNKYKCTKHSNQEADILKLDFFISLTVCNRHKTQFRFNDTKS